MGPWIVYILLGIIILGLGGYIYLLIQKQKAEESKWRWLSEQRYKEGRSEASQILRSAVDQIADDKNRLEGLSDRELLLETVMGLGGLGRRMDRMEDSIHSVSHLEELLGSVNEQAAVISENAELLSRQVTEAQNSAASFQSVVEGTSEAVYSLSDSTHSIEQLLTDVSEQLTSLTDFSVSFSELQEQIRTVIARMNQTLRVSTGNPAAALTSMDGRMGSLETQLQNLSEGLNLMAESLERMQDTLESVNSRTQVIHGKIDTADKSPQG